MLLIPCPHCGHRDEIEFRWGGDSHVTRPPLEARDVEWADYLFVRRNPKGRNLERWHHWAGCRQWFLIDRDTASHAIVASYELGKAPTP
jgi:sarcosine oxidase subunit delta